VEGWSAAAGGVDAVNAGQERPGLADGREAEYLEDELAYAEPRLVKARRVFAGVANDRGALTARDPEAALDRGVVIAHACDGHGAHQDAERDGCRDGRNTLD